MIVTKADLVQLLLWELGMKQNKNKDWFLKMSWNIPKDIYL